MAMTTNEGQPQVASGSGQPGAGQVPASTGTTSSPGVGGVGTGTQGASPLRFGGKEYASVDELGKAYEAANSELGKWTQQHGDLKKQYDDVAGKSQQWDQWWATVKPLWGEDVEKLLQQKMAGGGRQPQAQPQGQQMQQNGQQMGPQQVAAQLQQYFDGYEVLPAHEQFMRVRQLILGELGPAIGQQMAALSQGFQQALQEKESYYNKYLTSHLSLMRKALERKISDPSFDVDRTMEQALKAIGGQFDPIELGQQLITAGDFDTKMEAAKKEAYAQAKADLEQAQKNKAMETVPIHAPAPAYKASGGVSNRTGLGTLREQAAQRIQKEYGPGFFAG